MQVFFFKNGPLTPSYYQKTSSLFCFIFFVCHVRHHKRTNREQLESSMQVGDNVTVVTRVFYLQSLFQTQLTVECCLNGGGWKTINAPMSETSTCITPEKR